ncbi:gamma-glutamyltransferase [Sphingomonas sp. MMS24-JH45]
MRRRTFLAPRSPPTAALAETAFAQTGAPRSAGRPRAGAGRRAAARGRCRRAGRPARTASSGPTSARATVRWRQLASRTAVYGLSGAAGSARPLATQAGIDMLRRGGSAVDAAIAMNACLGLLEPTANGIGGDGYAMIWDPKAKKVVGLTRLGPIANRNSTSRPCARARRTGRCPRSARCRCRCRARSTRGGRWPALREAALGRPVPARDRACRERCAGAGHDRILHPPQPRRLPPSG